MSVKDKLGREITIGTYIIYPTTGTIGEVLDIKTEDGASWVLLQYDELTRLWYNTQYVEVTDKSYAKIKDSSDNDKDKEIDLKEHLKEELKVEMGDDAVGGG